MCAGSHCCLLLVSLTYRGRAAGCRKLLHRGSVLLHGTALDPRRAVEGVGGASAQERASTAIRINGIAIISWQNGGAAGADKLTASRTR